MFTCSLLGHRASLHACLRRSHVVLDALTQYVVAHIVPSPNDLHNADLLLDLLPHVLLLNLLLVENLDRHCLLGVDVYRVFHWGGLAPHTHCEPGA